MLSQDRLREFAQSVHTPTLKPDIACQRVHPYRKPGHNSDGSPALSVSNRLTGHFGLGRCLCRNVVMQKSQICHF